MSKEPTDKYFGMPMSEWIERTPNELEQDAVGLWNIVAEGRDSFELQGEELQSFVHRSILALVRRGAVPVRAAPEPDKFWNIQCQYGNTPDEIAKNVINEWVKSEVDPDENGLWFALQRGRCGQV